MTRTKITCARITRAKIARVKVTRTKIPLLKKTRANQTRAKITSATIHGVPRFSIKVRALQDGRDWHFVVGPEYLTNSSSSFFAAFKSQYIH